MSLQTLQIKEQELDEIEATLRTKQTDSMHFEEARRRLQQEDTSLKHEVASRNSAICE